MKHKQHFFFHFWLISHKMMISSCIYFLVNDIISLFFVVWSNNPLCEYATFFISSSVDGHISWFHNLGFCKYYHPKHGCEGISTDADLYYFRYIQGVVKQDHIIVIFLFFKTFWKIKFKEHKITDFFFTSVCGMLHFPVCSMC
jgi:hypothetical protein